MKQKDVIPADARWTDRDIRELAGSPIKRIGDEWMLITAGDVLAGDKGNWNTMTASWGGFGVLWGRAVAFMFIRPVRHTFGFANQADLFSLSFFGNSRQKALELCGSQSGRDIDKAAEAGLTPIVFSNDEVDGGINGAIGFQEATEIILCKKLYTHDFDPAQFLLPALAQEHYPQKDYHRMFIGEVLGLKVRG